MSRCPECRRLGFKFSGSDAPAAVHRCTNDECTVHDYRPRVVLGRKDAADLRKTARPPE